MKPANEAAAVVIACQDLDGLMKRKYMFIGGTVVMVVNLLGLSIVSLFLNADWFIFSISLPFIVWYGAEHYIGKLNKQIQYILSFIHYHHENDAMHVADVCLEDRDGRKVLS